MAFERRRWKTGKGVQSLVDISAAKARLRHVPVAVMGLCALPLVQPDAVAAEAPAWCVGAAAKRATPPSAFETRLADQLQSLCVAEEFSGVVVVTQHGRTLFAGAYGLADRERRTPVDLDTKFRFGSAGKMFTAIAVLQLAQSGKIRLDDPVGHYLPDYPNKELATQVTVRELLNHTGGTGDIFGPPFEAHRAELHALDDYERLYGARAPAFQPGSHFSYSNYGYVLLGLIVEHVSGESYYAYVERHVFRPARMVATGFEPEDAAVADRANGYMKPVGESGGWEPNSATLPLRGTSAGGGYSTAGDLGRFAHALATDRLLTRHWMRVLTTSTVDMDFPGFRYASGFMETTVDGVRWIGHSGGAPGQNAEFWMAPTKDAVMIVLSNLDPPSATGVARFIAPLLPRER